MSTKEGGKHTVLFARALKSYDSALFAIIHWRVSAQKGAPAFYTVWDKREGKAVWEREIKGPFQAARSEAIKVWRECHQFVATPVGVRHIDRVEGRRVVASGLTMAINKAAEGAAR